MKKGISSTAVSELNFIAGTPFFARIKFAVFF